MKPKISYIKNTPKWRYEWAIEVLETSLKNEKNRLLDVLLEYQNTCDHKDTAYYPDPSGNHDSYRECNYCGKIL